MNFCIIKYIFSFNACVQWNYIITSVGVLAEDEIYYKKNIFMHYGRLPKQKYVFSPSPQPPSLHSNMN